MAAADFREAIRAAGLTPPDVVEPGRFYRFPGNEKGRGNTAGWCKLFPDGMGGVYGDYSTGLSEQWQARRDRPASYIERETFREQVKRARAECETERTQLQAEAASKSAERWKQAQPAPDSHPYLVRKGIKPNGARLIGDTLLVPMRDVSGELRNLQRIPPDGDKRFQYGGRVTGCYYSIGKPNGAICVVEGFATGASVYEATGQAVAVSFNAGNLEAVARELRTKYPEARIVLCADDDYRTDGNPGVTKATEAARSVGGLVAVPDFGTQRAEGATDFNDLAQHCGAEAIERAIANARAPDTTQAQPASDNAAPVDLAGHDWPQPLPLPTGLQPVEPFAFELLPDTLQPWARDICERVQCPPDFVGAAIMAALGAVIGRKVGIRPQEKTDWTVLPNQWALCIGRPGVLKSPAMEAALAPLKRLAASAINEHEGKMQSFAVEAKLAKLRAEAGEKVARGKLSSNPNANVRDDLATDEPEAPKLRRYIANDATAAALGELLRQNPNGSLVFRDELVSLLKTLDREDNAEARGFYLTGWNGDSAYTFDRIGRGMNLHIPAVCISVLGSTQPGRVAEYVRAAVRGGSADDGLIQRFGLAVWPDTGGEWRNVDRWPDSAARDEAHYVFQMLDTLSPEAAGAQSGEFDAIPFLRFDGAAHGLFLEWRTKLEARLRGGELHPAMEAHLAKYRKLVPGLALILHLADRAIGPVTERAVLRALAWAEYLESHADRLYASAVNPEAMAAKAIIERINRGDLAQKFSSRDVWRPGWAHLSDRDNVGDALLLLAELDWLTCERVETAGRTATVYHVNPKGLQS